MTFSSACAAALPRPPRIAPPEALEDALLCLWRDARALVGDDQLGVLAAAPHHQANRRRGRGVGPGVGQQVVDHLAQPHPIAEDHRLSLQVRGQEAVGGDGFAIRQGIWPGYVRPFAEQVVPLLQQRGAARTEYAGTTLREHLREF